MDRGTRGSLQNRAGLRVYFYLERLGEKTERRKEKKKEIQVTDHGQNQVLMEEAGPRSRGQPSPLFGKSRNAAHWWGRSRGIRGGSRLACASSQRLNGFVGDTRKLLQTTPSRPRPTQQTCTVLSKHTCRHVSKWLTLV